MGRARRRAGGEAAPSDDDRYLVVAGTARSEVRERGSVFVAECGPVASEGEARARVAAISSRLHDATHHCWALRLGEPAAGLFRAHDGGELAGTAGAPILQAIDARALTGTLVVVSRWFGGVKLGTAGLVRCYGAAAAAALDAAGAIERFHESEIAFRVAHADLAAAQRVVFGLGGRLAKEAYGADAALTAAVRRSRAATLREALIEATAGRVRFEEAVR